MRRASLIRTSVERTVASTTTGATSDGGCGDTDMADGTYWLLPLIGYLDFRYILGYPGRHLRQATLKTKSLRVKIKGIGIEKSGVLSRRKSEGMCVRCPAT